MWSCALTNMSTWLLSTHDNSIYVIWCIYMYHIPWTKSNYQGLVQQNAWKEFELWQQMQNENEMMKWNEMKTKTKKQNKLREKQTIEGKVAVEDSASSLWRLPRAPREPRTLFQSTSRTLPERLARRDLHFEDSSHFTSKVFTLHLKVFTKALHTSPRVFTLHTKGLHTSHQGSSHFTLKTHTRSTSP